MMHHVFPSITTALFLFSVLVLQQPLSATAARPSGLQSGHDDEPTFSGGMAYDAASHAVYLTGATYGTVSGNGLVAASNDRFKSSSCFVATVKLPSATNDDDDDEKLQWIDRQLFGTTDIPEACSSLAISSDTIDTSSHTAAYIMATTEDGGLLTELSAAGGVRSTQFGSVLNFEFASTGEATLLGGMLMDDEPVQYPVAIVADPSHEYIYVASMFSSETVPNPDFVKYAATQDFPNLTLAGLRKFGTTYRMLLERIQIQHTQDTNDGELKETLIPTWRLPLGTTGGAYSIFATGMVQVNSELLVVVGSTRGHGTAVGGVADDETDESMNGFITKFNPNTGGYVSTGTNAKQSAQFGMPGQEDWSTKVCVSSGEEQEFIYIVGATTGYLDTITTVDNPNDPDDNNVDAYVSKINVITLQPVWTKQFHASNPNASGAATYALDCKVTDDGSLVYVAGIVENGAAIESPTVEKQRSNGRDDIFIVQLDNQGTVNWLHQIGTSGNEGLAHGGGLAIDKNDNAILFGDTTGEFYRSRQQDAQKSTPDIFVMTVDKVEGAYTVPTEFASSTSVDDGDVFDGSFNGKDSGGGGGDNFIDPPKGDGTIETQDNSSSHKTFILLVLVLIVCFFLVVFFVGRANRNKEIATERAHVFSYLQAFDVEDVDLRHSATGGWHGTYVNRLAHGINKDSDSVDGMPQTFSFETAPLTHSSIVTDSLFMDVDTKPSLGPSSGSDEEDESMGSGSRGYDGLVSAYGDLQPRSYKDRKSNLEGKPWGREIV